MLKHINQILLSFLLIGCYNNNSLAQTNLVPNPSFEQQSSCPDNFSEIYKATGWINFEGTPDLISSCSNPSTLVSAPNHGTGYQYAASGTSYASVATYQLLLPNTREYIGTNLITPLVKNTKYFISMKISAGFTAQQFNVFTNNMSLLFTNYITDSSVVQTFNNSHLRCNNVLTDTTNWITISGSFTADSNYTHLVIGNLYDDTSTMVDTTIAHQQGYAPQVGYCFVDDICVSTDSAFAYNYSYVGINKIKLKTPTLIYPNPSKDYLIVETEVTKENEICLINLLGEKKYCIKTTTSKTIINTSLFEPGVYFLKMGNPENENVTKVIINP